GGGVGTKRAAAFEIQREHAVACNISIRIFDSHLSDDRAAVRLLRDRQVGGETRRRRNEIAFPARVGDDVAEAQGVIDGGGVVGRFRVEQRVVPTVVGGVI